MIELDFYFFISIYLFVVLLLILGKWFLYKEKDIKLLDFRYLNQCPICFYTYLDFSSTDYSICPRCNSYTNKKEEK